MKKLYMRALRSREIPSAESTDIETRLLRMSVVRLVKEENLSPKKERRAIDLLLGFKGSLPVKSLERLYEKLIRKNLKK